MKPDFGNTASDYARHRAGFPESFFARVAASGIGRPGQRIVDLGTGTGTLARGFARRGCDVIGIDPAEAMLAQARALDEAGPRERGLGGSTRYLAARAEDTGLPSACADIVSAGQCWHWFDRPRAAREVARLLAPEGRVLIAHFDWLPLGEGASANLVRATEELIERFNPSWTMGNGLGVHPQWLRDLGEAGFRDIETFSYDESVLYTPEAWRGRIRASAGVAASLPADRVTEFDAALAQLLASRYPGDVLDIPHRVFAVIARRPPSDALG